MHEGAGGNDQEDKRQVTHEGRASDLKQGGELRFKIKQEMRRQRTKPDKFCWAFTHTVISECVLDKNRKKNHHHPVSNVNNKLSIYHSAFAIGVI